MEREENHEDGEPEKWWRGPFKFIIALFLLLLMVLWVFPYYSIKLNPEPRDIPSLGMIQSQFVDDAKIGNDTGTKDIRQAAALVRADNPAIKQVATKISAESCPES